jgi:hypothetical protein
MILNTIAERVFLLTLCTLSAFGIIGIVLIVSNLHKILKLLNAADDIRYIAYLVKKDFEEQKNNKPTRSNHNV